MNEFSETPPSPEALVPNVFEMAPIRETGAFKVGEFIVQAYDHLVSSLDRWCNSYFEQNGLDPTDEILEVIGYHMIELAKNAYENSEEGGRVTMEIVDDSVHVIVEDNGPGFDPIEAQGESRGGGYALAEAIGWADSITIETCGKLYSKPKRTLKLTGTSEVTTGSRVTFTKKFR